MTDDGWIPFDVAARLLGGRSAQIALKDALVLGSVRSSGIVPHSSSVDPDEPQIVVDIPSNRWAAWVFLPICSTRVPLKLRQMQWLVPRGHESKLVCSGYGAVLVSREDVEKLAANESERSAGSTTTASPGRRDAKQTAPKPSIPESMAQWMVTNYPGGRPSLTSGELAREFGKVDPKRFSNPSPKSVQRAIKIAWPTN
jgi:hypothetical protein